MERVGVSGIGTGKGVVRGEWMGMGREGGDGTAHRDWKVSRFAKAYFTV
jgi:hypothetical protein